MWAPKDLDVKRLLVVCVSMCLFPVILDERRPHSMQESALDRLIQAEMQAAAVRRSGLGPTDVAGTLWHEKFRLLAWFAWLIHVGTCKCQAE